MRKRAGRRILSGEGADDVCIKRGSRREVTEDPGSGVKMAERLGMKERLERCEAGRLNKRGLHG